MNRRRQVELWANVERKCKKSWWFSPKALVVSCHTIMKSVFHVFWHPSTPHLWLLSSFCLATICVVAQSTVKAYPGHVRQQSTSLEIWAKIACRSSFQHTIHQPLIISNNAYTSQCEVQPTTHSLHPHTHILLFCQTKNCDNNAGKVFGLLNQKKWAKKSEKDPKGPKRTIGSGQTKLHRVKKSEAEEEEED